MLRPLKRIIEDIKNRDDRDNDSATSDDDDFRGGYDY